MAVLRGLDPSAPRPLEVTVLIAASICATVTRYVALRTWVFARHHRTAPTTPVAHPGA
jgi:putative flippase GtrA